MISYQNKRICFQLTFYVYFLKFLKLLAPIFLLSCHMVARPNFSLDLLEESSKDIVNFIKIKLPQKLICKLSTFFFLNADSTWSS